MAKKKGVRRGDPARARRGGFAADERATFLALSATLTGFTPLDLEGTGVADELWKHLRAQVDAPTRAALWRAWRGAVRLARGNTKRLERAISVLIFGDARYAPIARDIVQMWYLGSWVPPGNPFGATVVSAEAYREGLLWQIVGTHPMGAKQPGHGTWALPPALPPV